MAQYEYLCAAGHRTTEIRRIADRDLNPPTCAEEVTLADDSRDACGLPTLREEIAANQGTPHEAYKFRWIVNGKPTEAQSSGGDGGKKRGPRTPASAVR